MFHVKRYIMKAIKLLTKNGDLKEISIDDDFYQFITDYLLSWKIYILTELMFNFLKTEFDFIMTKLPLADGYYVNKELDKF